MEDWIDAAFIGGQLVPVRVVCFPEFSLGGCYSRPDTTTEGLIGAAAITVPGPETERIAQKAIEKNTYVALGVIEKDEKWNFWYNTGIIINPKGKIILRYRKWHTSYGISPHSIFDEFTDPITGAHDPFPVVETEIGRLAVSICADMHSQELYRVYGMKGADVVLHLTCGSPVIRTPLYQARAVDNGMYIVVENFAGITCGDGAITDFRRTYTPLVGVPGRCAVYNPTGFLQVEAPDGGEQVVIGVIDIAEARKNDPIERLMTEFYAPHYAKPVAPKNIMAQSTPADRASLNSWTAYSMKRAQQAKQNRQALYNYYLENDVK